MIKQETIELAAKWWKNKIKHHFEKSLEVAENQEKFHHLIEPLKDVLSKMDAFEHNLFEQLSNNKEDYIVCFNA